MTTGQPLPDAHERHRAAADLDVNLVVTAGAGTGKTSLVIERLLHHLLERGTPIERIAAITFTRKASAEMRERLEDALERTSTLLTAGADTEVTCSGEAERVLARLGNRDPEELLARCRRALDALDDAAIGTIHGLAGDVLRRQHAAAGIDVAFAVDDDERAFAEVFHELWQRHVTEDTLVDARKPTWHQALAKLSLAQLEQLARSASSFRFTRERLAAPQRDLEIAHLGLIAGEIAADLAWIRAAVLPLDGVNRQLSKHVENAEGILGELRAGRPIADRLAGLRIAKAPGPGKHVDCDPRELAAIARRVARPFERLHRAATLDASLADEALAVVTPFVTALRDEFLRLGNISNDGLIVLCRDVLRDHPDVRRSEGARYDHLLVDEFQDTDPLQYEIVFFLSQAIDAPASSGDDAFAIPLAPGRLFIVGDAKQSIYRFRGADIDAYRRAVEAIRREGGDVLTLSANFRSVPELVEPLNELFTRYFGDDSEESASLDPDFDPLVAQRPARGSSAIEIWSVGERGQLAPARRRVEAETIAAWLRQGLDAKEFAARDVAILLRSLAGVDPLLRCLRRADVPYVVESSRDFYTRQEVELFVSLLRVVVTPADPVPLVACLRSALGAVPDPELHRHAERHGGSSDAWRLDADVDPAICPRLAAALAFLRDFAARHRGEALARVAFAALDETPLRLAMAASYEGAQRVVNLEKLARRVAEFGFDGTLSAREILLGIEAEEDRERGDGDSPLADESLDAVNVQTMHSAKGLEWPIVVLPDLTRTGRSPSMSVALAAAPPIGGSTSPGLALHVSKDLETPSWARLADGEAAHDRAERKRLLYVASTRARDRLVLVVGPPSRGSVPWVEPLGHWGYELDLRPFPEAASFLAGAILHRRIPRATVAAWDSGDGSVPDLDHCAARFERLREALARSDRAPGGARAIGASGRSTAGARHIDDGSDERERLPRRRESATDGTVDVRSAATTARRIARAAGSALHHLLERADGADRAWLRTNAPRAAAVAAARERVDAAAVTIEVERYLVAADACGVLDDLRSRVAAARELPLLFRDDDGTIHDGVIDRVEIDGERIEVLDFKTSAASPAEELSASYAKQLELYAEGLGRALRLPERPSARVVAILEAPS